jgi:hypothetical protein
VREPPGRIATLLIAGAVVTLGSVQHPGPEIAGVSKRQRATAQARMAPAAPQSRGAAERHSLASLPLPTQMRISGVLGRDDRRYEASATPAGFRSTNDDHGLIADFAQGRVVVRAGLGHLELTLRSFGYGEELLPVPTSRPTATKNRVQYRHGAVTEWYVNGPLGLEQGFTLAAPPANQSSGPLTLGLALSGTLRTSLMPEGRGLELALPGRRPASLRYGGLSAWDANGRALPARLAVERSTLLIRVEDRGARYPLTIDPQFEQAKLTAADGMAGDWFGGGVAISGDTIVVGASSDDIGSANEGSAYVFVKPINGWANATETAKLTASDGGANDAFGSSVAVSGGAVVVGAPLDAVGGHALQGSVYVFVKPDGGWADATETAKLTASDGAPDDRLGGSVAVSGDTVVAGAALDSAGAIHEHGSAYVFVKPINGWADATETAKLTASDGVAHDWLGYSVAIGADAIVAGAVLDDVGANTNQGSAYVFVKPGNGWVNATQTAKLTASDGTTDDNFGSSVAVNGDTVVAGAYLDDVGANADQGSAYVFVKPDGGWANATEAAKLTASDGAAADGLGIAIAASADRVVVGARSDDVGANVDQGSAYVFVKPAGGWANETESAKLIASDGAADDWLGLYAIGTSGDTVVAGAPADDIGGNSDQGSAYVFAIGPPAMPGYLRVTTNPPVASQILIDGKIANGWGLDWLKLSPGAYTLAFTHVEGYTEPAPQEVTITAGQTTNVNATFTQRGSLRVITNPPVPGTISVDGVPRNDWGLWTDLPIGNHQVCFGPAVDFDPPACQNATLQAGQLTTVTGTYTSNPGAPGEGWKGMLRVITSPAVSSQILLDGRIANSWGLDWLKLGPAYYTVSFAHVEGYTEPASQEVHITAGNTATVSGTFTQRGSLRVITSPAVPGTITVDGIPRNDWGMWTDIPTGNHQVCFSDVQGFTTPPCQNVTVIAGQLTTVTGNYS